MPIEGKMTDTENLVIQEDDNLYDNDLELFYESFITNKNELLDELNYQKRNIEKRLENDFDHSAAFYNTLLSLMNEFIVQVENTVLFNKLEPFWAYNGEVSSSGVTLMLTHYSHISYYEDHSPSATFVDQDFELVKVHSRMLTVDEYAQRYGIKNVTVRQWIRRGKLRTAQKIGGEWRIPELTDYPQRGYKFGQYRIDKNAIFSDEYSFISEYSYVTFEQDRDDKAVYHVHFSNAEHDKRIECDNKEREKIEMMLIENPYVKYISDDYWLFG